MPRHRRRRGNSDEEIDRKIEDNKLTNRNKLDNYFGKRINPKIVQRGLRYRIHYTKIVPSKTEIHIRGHKLIRFYKNQFGNNVRWESVKKTESGKPQFSFQIEGAHE